MQSLPGSVVLCTGEVSAIIAIVTYDFKCFLLTSVPALGTFANCNLAVVTVGLVRVILLGNPVIELFCLVPLIQNFMVAGFLGTRNRHIVSLWVFDVQVHLAR